MEYLMSIWRLSAQMAPYLLFGFLAAGLLHALVHREYIERHLGRRGLLQIMKATLIGIPLPLCSCSVIPVSASLRRHGAGKGATTAFLASTPQTGVDSMAATWGLLGPLFTAVRVAVALVSGAVVGFLVDRLGGDDGPRDIENQRGHCEHCEAKGHAVREIWRYGFVELPSDIGVSLLIGIGIAGLVSALAPADMIAAAGAHPILIYAAVTLAAVPLYVCATASIPLALSLIHLGVSPGAALVFLIAGPATNGATMSTVWHTMGKKTLAIYLLGIIATAWLAGAGFDLLLNTTALTSAVAHAAHAPAPWQYASALILYAVIAFAVARDRMAGTKHAG